MPWLLEHWEVNTVLKTPETCLIRDRPLWQKHTAVYQTMLLLHGSTISVSFLASLCFAEKVTYIVTFGPHASQH